MEVLSKDGEISAAISIARAAAQRVEELGTRWLSDVLHAELGDEPFRVRSLLVNRDFLPSGWIHDDKVPVVDLKFFQDFFSSGDTGLSSLHDAAMKFDEWLKKERPLSFGRDEIKFGEYVFEVPTIERRGW